MNELEDLFGKLCTLSELDLLSVLNIFYNCAFTSKV